MCREPDDGIAYTKAEFVEHCGGTDEWDAAPLFASELLGAAASAAGADAVSATATATATGTPVAAAACPARAEEGASTATPSEGVVRAGPNAPSDAASLAPCTEADAVEADPSDAGPWWYLNVSRKTIAVRTQPRLDAPRTGMGVRTRTCHAISRRVATVVKDSGGLEVRFLKLAACEGWVFDTHPTLGRTLMQEVHGPDARAMMHADSTADPIASARSSAPKTTREDEVAVRREATRRRQRERRVREMRDAIAEFRAADDGTGTVRLDALDGVVQELARVCADAGLDSISASDILARFGSEETGHLMRPGFLRLRKHVWLLEDTTRFIDFLYAMLDHVRDSAKSQPLRELFAGAVKMRRSSAPGSGGADVEVLVSAAPRHATTLEEVGALLDVSCDGEVYESQIEGSIRALLTKRVVLIERCAAPSAGGAEESAGNGAGAGDGAGVEHAKEGDADDEAGGGGSTADLFEDWDAGLYGANTVHPLNEGDAL